MSLGGRRAGAPVRSWWGGLSPWTGVSLAGLVAAGVLAVGLGFYLPHQVERHLLESELAVDRQVLGALLSSRLLDPSAGENGFRRLDRFVHRAVLRGDYVRVKLWTPDAEIAYSDERSLVGRRYEPELELVEALAGHVGSDVSHLDAPENVMERELADRLLEIYLPIERDGDVVGVWEVYRSMDRLDAALGRVRRAVWASVGGGLTVLLLFLVSSFGSLLSTAQRRRREAEQHSRELGTLVKVSRAAGASLDPDALARDTVRTIQEEGGIRLVALLRPRAGDGVREIIAVSRDDACPGACFRDVASGATPRPARCDIVETEVGTSADRLVLVALRERDAGFTAEERALLAAAGDQLRIALENARLYESLRGSQREQRQLLRRLVSAHEEERKRIVGEIHDGIGQDLHRVLFGLRGCRPSPASDVDDELARLEALLEQSSRRLRGLLQDLRPPSLDEVGLAASLRGLADRCRRDDELDVDVQFVAEGAEPAVPVRVAVFRVVQEALRNVAKHARTTSATVRVAWSDRDLVVEIADQGGGSADGAGDGLGLWLMHERIEAVGGTLSVVTGAQGTVLTARIPSEESE